MTGGDRHFRDKASFHVMQAGVVEFIPEQSTARPSLDFIFLGRS
jgi:hypothetical protein